LETRNIGYDIFNYANEFKVFEPNIGYLFEQLTAENGKSFLLISDSSNDILSYTTNPDFESIQLHYLCKA